MIATPTETMQHVLWASACHCSLHIPTARYFTLYHMIAQCMTGHYLFSCLSFITNLFYCYIPGQSEQFGKYTHTDTTTVSGHCDWSFVALSFKQLNQIFIIYGSRRACGGRSQATITTSVSRSQCCDQEFLSVFEARYA